MRGRNLRMVWGFETLSLRLLVRIASALNSLVVFTSLNLGMSLERLKISLLAVGERNSVIESVCHLPASWTTGVVPQSQFESNTSRPNSKIFFMISNHIDDIYNIYIYVIVQFSTKQSFCLTHCLFLFWRNRNRQKKRIELKIQKVCYKSLYGGFRLHWWTYTNFKQEWPCLQNLW